jgi:hypothetical protein
MGEMDGFITIKEAAQKLAEAGSGLTERELRDAARSGRIQGAMNVGGRCWMIPIGSLDNIQPAPPRGYHGHRSRQQNISS